MQKSVMGGTSCPNHWLLTLKVKIVMYRVDNIGVDHQSRDTIAMGVGRLTFTRKESDVMSASYRDERHLGRRDLQFLEDFYITP